MVKSIDKAAFEKLIMDKEKGFQAYVDQLNKDKGLNKKISLTIKSWPFQPLDGGKK